MFYAVVSLWDLGDCNCEGKTDHLRVLAVTADKAEAESYCAALNAAKENPAMLESLGDKGASISIAWKARLFEYQVLNCPAVASLFVSPPAPPSS